MVEQRQLNYITNDAYLILVYKDFDGIIVRDKDYKKISQATNILNKASAQAKTSTGQKLLKLVNMGITSSIAQSMVSKSGLSSSVQGRIQSSLYDILADGKVSKLEVAKDFIGSCTNELDSTAIAMGLPTSQALYSALAPDGSGVIAKDFVKHFQKKAEEKTGEKLAQRNKVAQDLTVLKFRLVSSETEDWATNLPSRKTQKGFNIVDAIENENETRDFEISIVNNEYEGVSNMYDYKDRIYSIRNNKIPFDIYVNDPYNKKQTVWKHCFFTSLNWENEGTNSLKVSMAITKIPEYEIKTENVSAVGKVNSGSSKKYRKQKKAKSSKEKSNKTSSKIKTHSSAGISESQEEILSHKKKEAVAQKKAYISTYGQSLGTKYYNTWKKRELYPTLQNYQLTSHYSSF